MKLSIIIVSWNVKNDLLACLSSLKQNPLTQLFEQIVIDNNSSDGTVSLIKQDYPEVTLIKNPDNRGFATANNQGLKLAAGQYVMLLNPDTIVHEGSLDTLVRFLDDNPDVGACGGKLLNEDGTHQASVRRFPTFRGLMYAQTVCRMLGIFRGQHRKWMMKDFGYDKQIDVDQIMGAGMLVRRSIIEKIGGMDESFFMYFEEVDLCYRIKEAGWRIVFLPDAIITHMGGRSSSQAPLKRVMMLTSMMTFFRKHRGKLSTAIFSIFFKPAVILRNFCHLILGLITFMIATIRMDQTRKQKAAGKVKLHALLLTRYLWRTITM